MKVSVPSCSGIETTVSEEELNKIWKYCSNNIQNVKIIKDIPENGIIVIKTNKDGVDFVLLRDTDIHCGSQYELMVKDNNSFPTYITHIQNADWISHEIFTRLYDEKCFNNINKRIESIINKLPQGAV